MVAISKSLVPATLLSCALFTAGPLGADPHPNLARGANAESMAIGDIDHVNVFNGNLLVTIPIGISYPVSPLLSYRLALVYNSQAWETYEVDGCSSPTTPTFGRVRPNRIANAGLGWTVGFGHLWRGDEVADNDTGGWLYVSADGAQHVFHNRLKSSDPEDPGDTANPNNSTYLYTRDGSFLRLRVVSGQFQEIDFPDGTIHKFQHVDGVGSRLVEMRDRYVNGSGQPLNWMRIAYTASNWTITDSTGRSHTVTLGASSPELPQVVTQVSLMAFDNPATPAVDLATFNLSYHPNTSLPRPAPHQNLGDICSPAPNPNVSVPLLSTVGLPDGTSFQVPITGYDTAPTNPRSSGTLLKLNLPLAGSIEWTYQGYTLPAPGCIDILDTSCSKPKPLSRRQSLGVANRTLKDAGGATLGTWKYAPSLRAEGGFWVEAKRVVMTPLGDRTENYFSVSPLDTGNGYWVREYGLPFVRSKSDGGSACLNGTCLSTKTFDCPFSNQNPKDSTGCTEMRTTELTYEQDETTVGIADAAESNRRVLAERTTFDDDGGRFAAVGRNVYDGVGHYRTDNLSGNFGAGDTRTNKVFWKGGRPAITEPWLLLDFDAKEQTENGVTERQEFVMNDKGTVDCERRLKTGVSRGTNDLIATYSRDANGQVTTESSYGGDFQPLTSTAADCVGLSNPEFTTNHVYSSGVRSRSYRTQGGLQLNSLDLTIDPRTGLASSSRDVAGVATNFTYDTSGRLLTVSPSGDAVTTYDYNVTAAQPHVQMILGPLGTPLEQERWDLDGLGRVFRHRLRLPNGNWAYQRYGFDAAGNKNFESVRAASASVAIGTNSSGFDAFGRPATVQAPDGKNVTFVYQGTRIAQRTATVWNGASEISWTTTEETDRQGRLFKVTEPNGTVTRYSYDAGSRLSQVCQNLTGSCGQTRTFAYDGRGLLTSEGHPEVASTTYQYNSLGQVRIRNNGFHAVEHFYDNAARLWKIENNVNQFLAKRYTYGTSGTSKGKVIQSERWVFRANTDVVVEGYFYNGPHGRLSTLDTQIQRDSVNLEKFRQSYAYDGAGRMTTITYPDCLALCPSSPRTVTTNYTYGRPTSIPGFATSITYAENGTLASVVHQNGITFTQGMDLNKMARPASFQAGALWSSGAYAYDGSGNVKSIGTQSFAYDSLSRLTSATIGAGLTESYGYDVYGNLTGMTRNGVLRSIPVNAATNRLTGATYNAAGSVSNFAGVTFATDLFQLVRDHSGGAEAWLYNYDVNDERVWAQRTAPSLLDTFTLRGPDGKVLREYTKTGSTYTWQDYVYREGQQLASVLSTGEVRHFDVDHLGSVRLVTNAAGAQVGQHLYWPYGEVATLPQEGDQMRFTGHERDFMATSGANPQDDDFDYMHARYYKPILGRFWSVDPVRSSLPAAPRTWNRYAYVYGNPLKAVDPDGELTQMVVGLHTEQNFFGHIALAIDGRVYSYGTSWVNSKGDWGVPLEAYLAAQDSRRQTEVLTLTITPEQETKLKAELESNNPFNGPAYNELNNSCVTVTENALDGSGVLPDDPGPVTVDRAGNELQAGSPKAHTPRELANRTRAQGLVASSSTHGRPVTPARSLWGTIRHLFRRTSS